MTGIDLEKVPLAKPKYIYGMICEDVRREVGGLRSLIGVYSPQSKRIQKIPSVIPQLAAVIVFVCPSNDLFRLIKVQLITPGGRVLERTPKELPTDTPIGSDGTVRPRLIVTFSPIAITVAGRMVLRVIADGEAWELSTIVFENSENEKKPTLSDSRAISEQDRLDLLRRPR